MKDDERRRRLHHYLSRTLHGRRQVLIERSGMSPGRISQLLSSDELPFGERAAAKLAQRLGLPDDYFETDHVEPPTLSEEALVFARYFDRLDRTSQLAVQSIVEVLLPIRKLDPTYEGMLSVRDQPSLKNRDHLIDADKDRRHRSQGPTDNKTRIHHHDDQTQEGEGP
jgi:hypothetical protein